MNLECCRSDVLDEWVALRKCLYTSNDLTALSNEARGFLTSPQRYCQFLMRTKVGEAIGFVEGSVRTDYVNGTNCSPVVYLESLFVKTAFRRKGVARRLLNAVILWAKSKGITEIASDADLANIGSQAMHQALGFAETERVVFYVKKL